jgi:DNA processing protein
VVVEAAEKGGALITARLGAEIGRPVLAVPGDVDREASAGCNRLIRDGAMPVLGPEDMVQELSLLLGTPPRAAGKQPDHGLPPTGARVGDLPSVWSMTTADALVRLAKLELDGVVIRKGDLVKPA